MTATLFLFSSTVAFSPHRCFCIIAPSSSLKRCSPPEALPLPSTAALSAPAPVILAPDSRSFVDYRACLSLAVSVLSTYFICKGQITQYFSSIFTNRLSLCRSGAERRAGGVENIHRRMTDKDTQEKDGLLMDNRDARRRHTLRGALIHLHTHCKRAHGKTDRHGDTGRRGKSQKISPPEAIPYFHGIGGTP